MRSRGVCDCSRSGRFVVGTGMAGGPCGHIDTKATQNFAYLDKGLQWYRGYGTTASKTLRSFYSTSKDLKQYN